MEWMLNNGILDRVVSCSVCNGGIRLAGKMFHCRSRTSRKQVSALNGSFLQAQDSNVAKDCCSDTISLAADHALNY